MPGSARRRPGPLPVSDCCRRLPRPTSAALRAENRDRHLVKRMDSSGPGWRASVWLRTFLPAGDWRPCESTGVGLSCDFQQLSGLARRRSWGECHRWPVRADAVGMRRPCQQDHASRTMLSRQTHGRAWFLGLATAVRVGKAWPRMAADGPGVTRVMPTDLILLRQPEEPSTTG